MNKETESYGPGWRMRDLVDDNNGLLLVLSRFAIPLGFGDATVSAVCHEAGVDCNTFLAVANTVSARQCATDISLNSMMGYLENSHSYFLDFILPAIREKLIRAINCHDENDVGSLILRYFDNYVLEVNRHMKHENDTIFPAVRGLLEGHQTSGVSLRDYSMSHDSMAEVLQELKDIVIRHYRHKTNNMLNYVLYDIINCEADLMSHCELEDKLFLPAAVRMESEIGDRREVPVNEDVNESENEELTSREKEVVACVARGMANKEIADSLRLSIHTVTTYRRNIASKLQIHSPAGLVIYAILHDIIDISDVKPQ